MNAETLGDFGVKKSHAATLASNPSALALALATPDAVVDVIGNCVVEAL
jgi:hypothetical protein